MTLGQRIVQLRTQNGWSQDDLSARLDVSRQSISKWENDASVPELDKLLRMADLFGVSLDLLVRGQPGPAPQPAPQAASVPAKAPPHRTAGLILLCTGLVIFFLLLVLGGGLSGLIFASPFLLCALVCFTARQHTGLWCGWAVFLCVDAYLRYATGLSWNTVIHTFHWTAQMNYVRLLIAWVQFAAMLALVVCTLRAFRGAVVALSRRLALLLCGGWALYIALPYGVSAALRPLLPGVYGKYDRSRMALYSLLNNLTSYLHLALLVVLLHYTLAAVRSWRRQKHIG